MKKCPWCAEQIQDEAIICRFCQRDLRQPPPEAGRADPVAARYRKQNRIVLSVCALLLLGLLGLGSRDVSKARQAQADVRRITAEVSLARARVEVTNRDTFAWTSTKVRLNPGLTGRYDCELGTVAPGEQLVVDLDNCTNDDGDRFDWQRRKPTAIAVLTTQGDRYFEPK